MKKHFAWWVCAAALAVGAVQATEWTLAVPEGETANMGPLVAAALTAAGEGARVADGDTFVKTGEGTLVFDTTGNTVDYCFTVEEGTLALGPTLAANTDWTGVLTAKEFAGLDECMADGFKMKIVVNDDGTSTLQMKPKVGSVLIIR